MNYGVEDTHRTAEEVPNDLNRAVTNAHIQWLEAEYAFRDALKCAYADDGKMDSQEHAECFSLFGVANEKRAQKDKLDALWIENGRPQPNDPNP